MECNQNYSSLELTHGSETKYLPLFKLHCKNNIRKLKLLCFDSNITEVCSQGSNQQNTALILEMAWCLNGRQAIIWANDAIIYCHTYVLLDIDDLMSTTLSFQYYDLSRYRLILRHLFLNFDHFWLWHQIIPFKHKGHRCSCNPSNTKDINRVHIMGNTMYHKN